jgi:leucyl-tRNA synthetase
MILAADGSKMSKSKGNVVIPNDYIEKYGADTFRMYVLFIAAFEDGGSWSDKSIIGVYKFLNKVWNYVEKWKNFTKKYPNAENWGNEKAGILHETIKKVGEDIENFKFNTATSTLMTLINFLDKIYNEGPAKIDSMGVEWTAEAGTIINKEDLEKFIIILSPFAPHIAEELWKKLGHKQTIFNEPWPEYDEKLIKKDKIDLIIQINGKVRDKIEVSADISEKEAQKIVLSNDKIKTWLNNQEPKKIIFVKGKLINIVI